MHKINSYNELIVWQKSVELVTEVYKITEQFPKVGCCGIVQQINQASVSIPAKIAEGWGNESSSAYITFLKMARKSVQELERLILLTKQLNFVNKNDFMRMIYKITETNQLLNSIINKLKSNRGSVDSLYN